MSSNDANAVYLAFDYGKRRMGVAVGQTITATATPLPTLLNQHGQPDWDRITTLVHEWKPQGLIVGQPILKTDNGSKHPLQIEIDDFCQQLAKRHHLPVYRVDESLTSASAYSELCERRRMGRKKRINKQEIDALSAAIMLESWMAESHLLHQDIVHEP